MDQSKLVREFTVCSGTVVCDKPEPMTETEVEFISSMLIDEMLELLSTVKTSKEAKNWMIQKIQNGKSLDLIPTSTSFVRKIAEQADALVDMEYEINEEFLAKYKIDGSIYPQYSNISSI